MRFQVRSHTSVHGRVANGGSRGPTSWRGTIASTPAPNPSDAGTATAASPAPTTSRYTPRGMRSIRLRAARAPPPATPGLTTTAASKRRRMSAVTPTPCLADPTSVAETLPKLLNHGRCTDHPGTPLSPPANSCHLIFIVHTFGV